MDGPRPKAQASYRGNLAGMLIADDGIAGLY
jgi:hypothetical protein